MKIKYNSMHEADLARNRLAMRLSMPRPAEAIEISLLGVSYARVGDVACFKLGRLFLYRRVGARTSIRPYLEPKKGATHGNEAATQGR